MSAAVENAIRAHLAANWNGDAAAIREPNTVFDPGGLPWIELRFPGAAIDRGDIGEPAAPLWDEAGAFMVDVYVPTGAGTAIATSLADAVWALFAGKEISGVRCDGRLEGRSGPREPVGVEGVWWGQSYGIAYRYLSVTVP